MEIALCQPLTSKLRKLDLSRNTDLVFPGLPLDFSFSDVDILSAPFQTKS